MLKINNKNPMDRTDVALQAICLGILATLIVGFSPPAHSAAPSTIPASQPTEEDYRNASISSGFDATSKLVEFIPLIQGSRVISIQAQILFQSLKYTETVNYVRGDQFVLYSRAVKTTEVTQKLLKAEANISARIPTINRLGTTPTIKNVPGNAAGVLSFLDLYSRVKEVEQTHKTQGREAGRSQLYRELGEWGETVLLSTIIPAHQTYMVHDLVVGSSPLWSWRKQLGLDSLGPCKQCILLDTTKKNWDKRITETYDIPQQTMKMAEALKGNLFSIDPKTINLEALDQRVKDLFKEALEVSQLRSDLVKKEKGINPHMDLVFKANALAAEASKLMQLASKIRYGTLLSANDMELVKSLMADGHLRIEYTGTPKTEEQPGTGFDGFSGQTMVQPSGLENSPAVRSFSNPLAGMLDRMESSGVETVPPPPTPPSGTTNTSIPEPTGGLESTMGQRFCACAGPGPFTLPTGGGPPGNVTNGAGSPWFDNGGDQNQVNQVAQNVVANASTAGQVFTASNGSSSGGGSMPAPPTPPPPPPPSLGSIPFVFQVSAGIPVDIGDVAAFSVVQLFVSPVPPVFLSPTQVTLSGTPQVLSTTVDPGSYQVRTSGVNFGADNRTIARIDLQIPPTPIVGPGSSGGVNIVTPTFPTVSFGVFTVQ